MCPSRAQYRWLGKTPQQIEVEIAGRLANKANQPQVLVRVIRNATQNVTVVGEVATSRRMPLTAMGERLLDAVAAAGGVRQPVGKITIQLSRGEKVLSMPLDSVIRDPKQNVHLQPGDVVTALFQNQSFTALGATVKNAEIEFEAKGISLAQALGRMAGLRDDQADARGFIYISFRRSRGGVSCRRGGVRRRHDGYAGGQGAIIISRQFEETRGLSSSQCRTS